MTSLSNAVLASHSGDTTAQCSSLCLASDVRGYSTTPTAHLRDLQSDGISATAQRVYIAISDRQTKEDGQCFRSNAGLGEELGLHKRTLSRSIAQLKDKNYLSVWYVNGGRRMRVLTRVSRGVDTGAQGGRHQRLPYKENNIKKTTQTEARGVSSISLSEKNRVLFGEGSVNRLVVSFGKERVQRGLLAWDAEDQSKIRNPIGWLTLAIKDGYEPRTANRVKQKFTECTFEHDKIIAKYMKVSKNNVDTVNKLVSEGKTTDIIAYRIWINKI